MTDTIISPVPTDEEAAAIVSAIEAAWPRPAAPVRPTAADTRWRFSGRWWHRSSPRHAR